MLKVLTGSNGYLNVYNIHWWKYQPTSCLDVISTLCSLCLSLSLSFSVSCMHTYMHKYTCTCRCREKHKHTTQIHILKCTHNYVSTQHTHRHTHMHTHLHACTHKHTHTRTRTHTHTHTHARTHARTHKHTHTHTTRTNNITWTKSISSDQMYSYVCMYSVATR